MDIILTETVWEFPPILCIILFLGALAGVGVICYLCGAEKFVDGIVFISLIFGLVCSATLILSFIAGGLSEKEYIYVDKSSISVEEILNYEIVADYGDILKLEEK